MTIPTDTVFEVTRGDGNAMLAGAILPSDMRVRLVRSDSAHLDTILSLFYSTSFSIFGVFLGAILSKTGGPSTIELWATVFLGIISVALLALWGFIKYRQFEKGITIPQSALDQFCKK
ncbi:MAG: hypothetical protein PHD76_08895 [Methylacidiphilales bacterium]|nr:hypothetical protein [Candidatus Methylacidiphilales bacterium]